MKIEFFLEINPGEVWMNDQQYTLKIIDVSHDGLDLWLEWENGYKGTMLTQKFFEGRYRLHKPAP